MGAKVRKSERKCKYICNFPNVSTLDEGQRYKNKIRKEDEKEKNFVILHAEHQLNIEIWNKTD